MSSDRSTYAACPELRRFHPRPFRVPPSRIGALRREIAAKAVGPAVSECEEASEESFIAFNRPAGLRGARLRLTLSNGEMMLPLTSTQTALEPERACSETRGAGSVLEGAGSVLENAGSVLENDRVMVDYV